MTLLEEVKSQGPTISKGLFDTRWLQRDSFVKNFAWAIPDEGAIKDIKEFVGDDKILEIGCGLGLWAKLLQDFGVNITPTNPNFPKDFYLNKDKKPFTEVLDFAHKEAVETLGPDHDVLMLCWPPYSESIAYEALNAFGGDKLIYIGESRGGCNATHEFFELLDEEWNPPMISSIPQWVGIHDSLYFYRRK